MLSDGFPMLSYGVPMLSYGFPMLSFGFPSVLLKYSQYWLCHWLNGYQENNETHHQDHRKAKL